MFIYWGVPSCLHRTLRRRSPVVRWKCPVNAGKLARFGSNLAPSRRRAQRLGSLFAELHCGLSLASTSAGTERAGWHLHLH